jgi:hypothetical protein
MGLARPGVRRGVLDSANKVEIWCRTWCSDSNKKNKLQNSSVIHETNLLSLINSSLAHVYCSTTLSNHGLIRLKNLSRKIILICVFSFVNSLYLILHACVQTFDGTATKV